MTSASTTKFPSIRTDLALSWVNHFGQPQAGWASGKLANTKVSPTMNSSPNSHFVVFDFHSFILFVRQVDTHMTLKLLRITVRVNLQTEFVLSHLEGVGFQMVSALSLLHLVLEVHDEAPLPLGPRPITVLLASIVCCLSCDALKHNNSPLHPEEYIYLLVGVFTVILN
jgi:hypothetical protein